MRAFALDRRYFDMAFALHMRISTHLNFDETSWGVFLLYRVYSGPCLQCINPVVPSVPFLWPRQMSRGMTKPTKWVCAKRRLRSAQASASEIRVFAVRSMGSQGHKLYSCGQRSLWSDWANAGRTLILLVLSCRGSNSVDMPQNAAYATEHSVWSGSTPFTYKTFNWKYEGCSGSSWNLVIKCSNIDILLSCFEISQVDIIELASDS